MPAPAIKLDVARAVDTIGLVVSGGTTASVDDLSQALAVLGQCTEATLKRLIEIGRPDIAKAYLAQLLALVPLQRPPG